MTDTIDFPEQFRSMQNWEEDLNQELWLAKVLLIEIE